MPDYDDVPVQSLAASMAPLEPKPIVEANKFGISISVELDHSPVLFAYPGTGCKLSGRVKIVSSKRARAKSLTLTFAEHVYYEFGVPRENKMAFFQLPQQLELDLNPGATYGKEFSIQLPDNLHTTVFTKFNSSRYELVASAKIKGSSAMCTCVMDVAFYAIPPLAINSTIASQPFSVEHELTQGRVRVTVPSPFVHANTELEAELVFMLHTPYYYLVGVTGQLIEMIEYTRSDGSVLTKEMGIDGKRIVSEIYDIQPTWHDPLPLTSSTRVSFKFALPKLITAPKRECWATQTSPVAMPNPNDTPYIHYDVANTHVQIRHGLSYRIEIWDVRRAPQFTANTVRIRVVPPFPQSRSISI
ncbi:hypothetical protein H4R26_001537 [Coemansia thaxteri]|uniref:Uncharacterized protein n=1 Tax=Coemansia thaxteri TaxID=2663907 RepID=A0A9W8BLJ6_9FUNG|nr:hypothetical protein H4R26_001537 [Coemansia thaxteri]